ncbi:putative ATP-binding cassette family ATPase [Starmerella bacillaris]|uniref:ATP-binding cassette family ATPase n=1 Tax=Starmerella bacillaris TaxID=1247836 RepID=A0AAV5RE76_STABA|nr:putative ATP-binding cassette family ATPase [Starmerella bacillaris]
MIETDSLYYVFNDNSIGLNNVSIALPTASRTLLIGANGAGKSTLLKVLAGKTLAKHGKVQIDGKDPFREGLIQTTYLGTEWATSTTVRRDVSVVLLIASVGGDAYPERRDELINLLDIDLTWRMHQVSDGERRRVQLCMGLLRPWQTLLLDEVTVDLDVVARSRLLDFLKKETETRNCQVVYATHIFDGLTDWPTHVVHMHLGQVTYVAPIAKTIEDNKHLCTGTRGTQLLEVAYGWINDDLAKRGARKPRQQWSDVSSSSTNELEHADRFHEYFKLTRR